VEDILKWWWLVVVVLVLSGTDWIFLDGKEFVFNDSPCVSYGKMGLSG
jgi:hypothetical protein